MENIAVSNFFERFIEEAPVTFAAVVFVIFVAIVFVFFVDTLSITIAISSDSVT